MRPCDSVDGHPLHAVHAALVLEVRPDALRGIVRVALDGDLDVLVAAEVGFGAEMISVFQPLDSAYGMYMRSRSAANSAPRRRPRRP